MIIEKNALLLGQKFAAVLDKLVHNDMSHVTSDEKRTRERVETITRSFRTKLNAVKSLRGINLHGLENQDSSIKVRPRSIEDKKFLVIEIDKQKFIFKEQLVEVVDQGNMINSSSHGNGSPDLEYKLVFIDVEWS